MNCLRQLLYYHLAVSPRFLHGIWQLSFKLTKTFDFCIGAMYVLSQFEIAKILFLIK